MDRRFIVLTIAVTMCVGQLAWAQGTDPNQFDYTLPAIQQFASTGTIAGMVQAYETLEEGVNDPNVTGDERQLILLHSLARAGMLVFDTENVAVQTSLLEVGEPLGITITGNKFFSSTPDDPDLIQLVLPLNPMDPNCLEIPPGADLQAAADAINADILPELDDIIAELNQVTNTPAFVMTLPAAQTGLEADIEVDWGDVLALRTALLSLRTILYALANPAYDLQIDLTSPLFSGLECGMLPEGTTINTILNTYPNLLEILPGTGPARLAQTKADLLAALDAGIATLDSILAETDDQSNDLLMMEAEDRAQNTALRTELAKFRNSLASSTAATYTLGSNQTFNLYEGAVVIGQLKLEFEPFSEEGTGWVALQDANEVPGLWDIEQFTIEGTTIQGDISGSTGMDFFTGSFTGTVVAGGAQMTNLTVQWTSFTSSDTITGLLAVRTLNEPVNVLFNPGPIFAGTISPRDALPQFDPNGQPIAGTMGHGVNNDATLAGVFPTLTQQDWFPSGFEIWGGNTNFIDDPRANIIFSNIDKYGYTRLGQSSGGNLTALGNFQYYVIVARGTTLVDSVRGSTGDYYNGPLVTSNVMNPDNILGAPDSLFATIGDTEFLNLGGDSFSGFVVLTNPGGWTNVTAITGGAQTLVTAAVTPGQLAASGTATSTITITVRDTFGNPVVGVEPNQIIVSTTPAGATIVQPTTATNAAGQTTARIASTTVGTRRINVEVNGVTFNEAASVVFTAGAANKLVFITQPEGPYVAGEQITPAPVVAVEDAQGNLITTSTAVITMAIGTNPGSGTLSGTTQHTALGGEATFPGLSINKAGTGYTLQASSLGLTSAVSEPFNVAADVSTARLVFTTQPANSPALGALVGPPVVTIQDQFGNPVTTLTPTVTLAIKEGTGSEGAGLIGTASVTPVNGVATFNNLKIDQAGTGFQLTATATDITGSVDSQAFNVAALPAMTIEKTDDSDPVDPNTEVEYTITYGNEGLAPGTGVVIRETLPAGLEFISAGEDGVFSGGTITWNVGTVAAQTGGQTVSFIARVTEAMADGGIITNSGLTITAAGQQPVGQVTPETTTVNDVKPPQVSGQIPEPNSISAAPDTIIRFHVTDAGSGADSDDIRIFVNGDLIYDGADETSEGEYDTTEEEQLVRGITRRTGEPNDLTFTFLPSTPFGYEQQVNVTAEVEDEVGNQDTVNYSFFTQMRTFGGNVKVNSDTGAAIQDNPAVAAEPNGTIWVVWDQRATASSDRDVYIAKLPADGNAFEPSVLIYNNSLNQANPAIAVDSTGKLYVAWEQWSATDPNRFIMLATSTNGQTWVSDPNNPPLRVDPAPPEPNTVVVARNPSMATGEGNRVYIAWEETRNGGDSDIWLRSIHPVAGLEAAVQITTDSANQTEPVVGVDSSGVVYVVWTDARNAATTGTDIFIARSNVGPWTNTPLVTAAGNQSSPALALASQAHIAWVDVNDLRETVLGSETSVSVLDPCEPEARPQLPSMAAVTTDANDRVFVTWVDSRDVVGANNDTDIYFAEGALPFGTNILVNDDTGASRQTKPAIAVDAEGGPVIVWVDSRNGNDDIFFAASTEFRPLMVVAEANQVTVPDVPGLEVIIPPGALPAGIDANDITIAEVVNPPQPPVTSFGVAYDFGPSGIVFDEPVTLRIPLPDSAPVFPFYFVSRYDAGTGTWTQEGIHNPATRVEGPEGTFLEVQVDHFTIFIVSGGAVSDHDGGGCALSPWSNARPVDFFMPFAALALALLVCRIVGGLWRGARGMRD